MKKADVSTAPPADFLARMRQLLPPDEYEPFAAAFDQPPRAGLRVNTLKISVSDFSRLAPFSLTPVGEWEPAAFFVAGDSRPGLHPYHDAGLYYLQEPSAMVAAALLAPRPEERVLDLAAAPGGKSTHTAALMAGPPPPGRVSALRRALPAGGLLVANDVHAGRARLLADNLARCGAVNVLVTNDEPERLAAAFGPVFDRVLIDAPCSGEGMIRRRESLEWSEAIVAACARRQRAIIDHAPDLVRAGGRLLYATCTFAPEENEQTIAHLLAMGQDFKMVEPPRYDGFRRGRPEWAGAAGDIATQMAHAVRLWPHHFPGEGHFLALLEREGEPADGPEAPANDRQPPTPGELRQWREFAAGALALPIPDERLHSHNGRLYLRPKTTLPHGRLRIVRYGLLLGEFRPGRFHPSHELALAMSADDAAQSLSLRPNDPRLAAYLSGAEEPAGDLAAGWVLVTVDGFGLGWGKVAGGRLKNHYPSYLRREIKAATPAPPPLP